MKYGSSFFSQASSIPLITFMAWASSSTPVLVYIAESAFNPGATDRAN
ncbi:MAG TPA: hypothetical protein VEB87_07750 [Nitrososphaerales archaeon]|nr:hypothetical protein [Nitrososphaerales archaeon]